MKHSRYDTPKDKRDMKESLVRLGNELRKARQSTRMNQADFAELVGKGQRSIVFYEKGEISLSIDVLLKWSEVTGVSIATLLSEKEDSKNTKLLTSALELAHNRIEILEEELRKAGKK